MGVNHRVSANVADVRLPTAERMTNSAFLFADKNPDSLGQIALAVNNLFNWARPSLINDMNWVNPWAVPFPVGVPVTVARYRVPAWPSGVGGAVERQALTGRFYGGDVSGGSTAGLRVQVDTSEGSYFSAVENFSTPSGYAEEAIGAFDVYDGDELIDVRITLQVNSGGQVGYVRNFQLDWEPRTDYLLSVDALGRYGGPWRHAFLPCDVTHLQANYNPGSVERVRRVLVDTQEMILRRTPQMIVTWSNVSSTRVRGQGAPDVYTPIGRIQTTQLPLVNYVEVHCRHASTEHIRFKIGPWSGDVPAADGSHVWDSVLIPVDPIREPFTRSMDFRVLDWNGGADISSLCAWWRIL